MPTDLGTPIGFFCGTLAGVVFYPHVSYPSNHKEGCARVLLYRSKIYVSPSENRQEDVLYGSVIHGLPLDSHMINKAGLCTSCCRRALLALVVTLLRDISQS